MIYIFFSYKFKCRRHLHIHVLSCIFAQYHVYYIYISIFIVYNVTRDTNNISAVTAYFLMQINKNKINNRNKKHINSWKSWRSVENQKHSDLFRILSIFEIFPANTKHLYNICTTSAQRLRRWSDIVQMLYKCFVFAGVGPIPGSVSQWLVSGIIPEIISSAVSCLSAHVKDVHYLGSVAVMLENAVVLRLPW